MNRIVRYLSLSAGVVLSATAMAAYVEDGFEAMPGPLGGRDQWVASDTSVIISNAISPAAAHSGTKVAIVPVVTSLTNVVQVSSNLVWTDFYTIARPFFSMVDDAPEVDTNATSQFYVNTVGQWTLVYRDGSMNLVTNSFTNDLYNGAITFVDNGATWNHVSVLSDYDTKTWSFFINGMPVATNLGFINTTASEYTSFAVESLGGAQSNLTMLDDFVITNAVPVTLTNDSNGNALRDAWELAYYGSLNSGHTGSEPSGQSDDWTLGQKSAAGLDATEPAPTTPFLYVFGTNDASGATNGIKEIDRTSSAGVTIVVDDVKPKQTYTILTSSSPNGPWASVGSFYSGSDGSITSFTDTDALTTGGTRSYYKVIATTVILSQTNDTLYAWYKQMRTNTAAAGWYLVGLPVNYGTNNTLDGILGAQLGQGLRTGNGFDDADLLRVYPSGNLYFWTTDGWYGDLGKATEAISNGCGVLIYRQAGSVGSDGFNTAILAGKKLPDSGGSPVQVTAGWNMLSWPYDSSSPAASWSFSNGHPNPAPSSADRIWLISGGQYKHLWLKADGWYNVMTGVKVTASDPFSSLKPGEGFFYNNSGANFNWAP